MKLPLGAKIILLLVATAFPLQAFPMFGEEAENHTAAAAAAAKEQQVERTEDARRRLFAPARETSQNSLTKDSHELSIVENVGSNLMENNNSISGGASIPPIVPGYSSAQTGFPYKAAETGSFQGHAVTGDPQRPPFRNYGSTATTTPTINPSNLKEGGFDVVPQDSDRTNQIKERLRVCENMLEFLKIQQKEDFSTEVSDDIFKMEMLIPVLENAITFQESLVANLKSQTLKSESRQASALLFENQKRELNKLPNKVEFIANDITRHFCELKLAQIDSKSLETCIENYRVASLAIPTELQEATTLFKDAVAAHRKVIKNLSVYGSDLRPSFEKIEADTQRKIKAQHGGYICSIAVATKKSALAWEKIRSNPIIIKEIFLARAKAATESLQEKFEIFIKLQSESARLFQQAADSNNSEMIANFDNAARAYMMAANEAEQEEPNAQIINLYTRSAELFQKAAASNSSQKMVHLNKAANTYLNMAYEAEHYEVRKDAINFYTRSAECDEKAACSNDARNIKLLKRISNAFFNAAQEAVKHEPREQPITLFTQSANFFEKAILSNDEDTIRALEGGGAASFMGAQEAQKDYSNQKTIDYYNSSAELYKQAAESSNKSTRELLSKAGAAFYKAAKEAAKDNPDERAITDFLNEAALAKNQAASAEDQATLICDPCTIS